MTMNTAPADPPVIEPKGNALPVIMAVIAFILFILAAGAGAAYFFYVKPKAELVSNSKKITASLPSLKDSIKKVDTSLTDMFNLITRQNAPAKEEKSTLLRLNVDSFVSRIKTVGETGQVAGASTSVAPLEDPLRAFTDEMRSTGKSLQSQSGFGKTGQVLGSGTMLESTRTTMLRQLKEYAKTGATSVTSANTSLNTLQNDMSSMVDSNLHTELYGVIKNLGNNNLKAQAYLSQAEKTTAYYEKIAQVQIKLEPALSSYASLIQEVAQSSSPEFYVERMKEIETEVAAIDKDIKAIPASEIPEGMNSLHEDNKKVGEIVLANVQEVRASLEKRNFLAFLKSIILLSQKLEPIVTRSTTTELTFWQDNKYLREGESILKEYEKGQKDAEEIIKKNKIPYFTGT